MLHFYTPVNSGSYLDVSDISVCPWMIFLNPFLYRQVKNRPTCFYKTSELELNLVSIQLKFVPSVSLEIGQICTIGKSDADCSGFYSIAEHFSDNSPSI